uniref:Uncharacterized protein n=1 Tax=Rhizophora mucronata TaxID=61149 RepID=A0A2P2Q588_RHIMU
MRLEHCYKGTSFAYNRNQIYLTEKGFLNKKSNVQCVNCTLMFPKERECSSQAIPQRKQ